jgi:hypothetical protein
MAAGFIIASIIFTTFLYLMVTVIGGITEASLWHLNSFLPMNKDNNKKLHSLWVTQRTLFGLLTIIPTIIFCVYFGQYLIMVLYPIALWLMHPFFHLGSMYEQRRELNPFADDYEKGWKSDPSSTSESKINIPYLARVYFMIFGLFIWVLCILIALL